MKPKVLKTEQEYQMALARVKSLMDAKPGSAKEDASVGGRPGFEKRLRRNGVME